MTRYIKKAIADIRSNRFMNLITIVTISLSILVVSLFLLFFENVSRALESWNQGGRAVVYLQDSFSPDLLPDLRQRIGALAQVEDMVFISKSQALERLKKEMGARTGFFDTLKNNPLPDSLQIRIRTAGDFEATAAAAEKIRGLDLVESVEYGQGWLGRFYKIFNLFKMIGYAMCGMFLLIALFITSNTVRLAFYSRKTEVEIMRLVGATERFIKTPFYVEGLFQGFLGGLLGLGILAVAYVTVSSSMSMNLSAYVYLDIRFLSFQAVGIIILSSTFLGWFGCYLSLKQLLK